MTLLERYQEALRNIPRPGGGGCHSALLGVDNQRILARLSAEQIFSDIWQARPARSTWEDKPMNIYQTPILLKGYHPDHNPTKDYKTAKTPIRSSIGFTKPEYKPPTTDEQQAWTTREGWIGHLVPEGMHVLDIEDPVKIKFIKALCEQKGITPPINKTNNGLQFIFSTNGRPPLPGADRTNHPDGVSPLQTDPPGKITSYSLLPMAGHGKTRQRWTIPRRYPTNYSLRRTP